MATSSRVCKDEDSSDESDDSNDGSSDSDEDQWGTAHCWSSRGLVSKYLLIFNLD